MSLDQLLYGYGQIVWVEMVLRIALAFVLGLVVARIYRMTHRGPSLSGSFLGTLVILSMLTCVVMMVIGNSLARAFGLVGALSIIRFRTAVKDTRDIAFVFFALAVGMATGTGAYALAVVSAVFVSLFVVVLRFSGRATGSHPTVLLRFQVPPGEHPEHHYAETFRKFLTSWKMLDVKTIRAGELLEMSFEVRLRDLHRSAEFVAMLTATEGLQKVHLVAGEQDTEMPL